MDSNHRRRLVSPVVLVGIVSFMAAIGLIVLWINDQKVYQSLLNSSFLPALKMEMDHKELPPVRILMMLWSDGKGMGRWMTYYCTVPFWTFLAISAVAIVLRHSIGDQSEAVLVLLVIGQLAATLWLQFHKSEAFKERVSLFGDKEFASMFDGTEEGCDRLKAVLAKRGSSGSTQGKN